MPDNSPQSSDELKESVSAYIVNAFTDGRLAGKEAVRPDEWVRATKERAESLVRVVEAYATQRELLSRIGELKKIHRYQGEGLPLRDYDNAMDELIDDRIAQLESQLKEF